MRKGAKAPEKLTRPVFPSLRFPSVSPISSGKGTRCEAGLLFRHCFSTSDLFVLFSDSHEKSVIFWVISSLFLSVNSFAIVTFYDIIIIINNQCRISPRDAAFLRERSVSSVKKRMLCLLCALSLLPLVFSGCGAAPTTADQLTAANAKLKAGDYAAALPLLDEALALDPGCEEAYRAKIVACTNSEPSTEDSAAEILCSCYEALLALDAADKDDYLSLAALYLAAGRNAKARDLLERGWRLYGADGFSDALFALVVDASSEEEKIAGRLTALCQALEANDQDTAVDLLLAEDWVDTMLPRRAEGYRRYSCRGAEGELRLQVGYEDGTGAVTRLWYLQGERTAFLRADANALIAAHLPTGGSGPYDAWFCEVSSGALYYDEGTFAAGLLDGDFLSQLAVGEPAPLAALWRARKEAAGELYSGEFQAGRALAAQQSLGDGKDAVVYAYNEGKNRYLYTGGEGENPEDVLFDGAFFALEWAPSW